MNALIDTHAHLDEYDDIVPVMEGARNAGLTAVIAVGLDIPTNGRTLEIAGLYPGFVYPAIGWYPANLDIAAVDENLRYLEANIVSAAAVGEIGLDYLKRVRDRVPKEFQQEILTALLSLARRHGKPALLHTRYAWKDALKIAVDAGLEKAVFHSFTGPSKILKAVLEAGYYVSVTPAVAYNPEMQRVVWETPLDNLMLETDCPIVFKSHRTGEEPSAVPADVLKTLRGAAELKGISEEALAAATTANARRLFGIG
ncbi:MAG: TatD family hydrolase [Dehalococcoidales bacterium]|nr:TatD family hydrolase [Dehalococcoidales bacterium]